MRPHAAVFVFHGIVPANRVSVVPPDDRPYVVPPEDFRALLLAARLSTRRALPVSAVPTDLGGAFYALTFDDGLASDYHEAFPVLRELDLRATFFVVPGLVDTPGYVRWSELREMVAAGMEIGSHSLTHPFVHDLDRDGLEREFGESKRLIEGRLGLAVRSASLPRGWEPDALRPVLRALGYRAFCTSRVSWWYPGTDPLSMPRVAVRRGMLVEDFGSIVKTEPRALWRMQAVEAAKNAAKACLGKDGWQRLRAPILALKERV
jgi:peptidoglycan/xylan/chitin deacetylase (PgdA/CDA1 family)